MIDSAPSRAPDPPTRKRRDPLPPLLVDAKGFSLLIPAGVRTIRTWDAAGKIPAPIRIGGRVVWRVDEIRDWIAAGAPSREAWEAIKTASGK